MMAQPGPGREGLQSLGPPEIYVGISSPAARFKMFIIFLHLHLHFYTCLCGTFTAILSSFLAAILGGCYSRVFS